MSVTRRRFVAGSVLAAGAGRVAMAEETQGAAMTASILSSKLERYRAHSEKGLDFLASRLQADGTFGDDPAVLDYSCYCKAPYFFVVSGELERAHLLLNYIQQHFLQENGDIQTRAGVKSDNPVYQNLHWTYPNTWVIAAAQKAGRWELAQAAYRYLKQYRQTALPGYNSIRLEKQTTVEIENIATSAMVMLGLYMGEVAEAELLGDTLLAFLAAQPDLDAGLYLKLDSNGKAITQFEAELAGIYFLDAKKEQQYYFMAGYPMAVLAMLYEATGKSKYLQGAKAYFEFASNCRGVRDYFFGHKTGWGASILYRATRDKQYADYARDICNHLVSVQSPDGSWLSDMEPMFSFDQTSEIGFWLREISANMVSA